jgi:hypothetical protein
MISGLQAAFLLFHNRVVEKLREHGDDRREEDDGQRRVFSEARRLDWDMSLRNLTRIIYLDARYHQDILRTDVRDQDNRDRPVRDRKRHRRDLTVELHKNLCACLEGALPTQ